MRILTALAILAMLAFTLCAADVNGKWKAETKGPDGEARTSIFTFKVDGEKLTGTVGSARGDAEISEGKVSGDEISFAVVRNMGGNEMKIQYTGKVAGNEIQMKMTFPGGDRTMEMVAKKM
jgi:hypothetical protein